MHGQFLCRLTTLDSPFVGMLESEFVSAHGQFLCRLTTLESPFVGMRGCVNVLANRGAPLQIDYFGLATSAHVSEAR
jgi:hypothetical protein